MSESPSNCPACGAALPANAPQGLCPKCLLLGVAAPTEPGGAAPAERPPPPSRESVAAAFPQLAILELIGQGGMGCVFKARQPQLNRFVALKILPEALSRDAAFATRFRREAQALASMNHPNIVTIHDFGQAGGFFYLLMEFVDGVNLRQALRAGRFTPEQALAIVPPLCDALQFAHDRGVIHRDIKPENLLLDRAGRVKIADFGIAKMLGAETSSIGVAETQPAGTPGYMAPEQRFAPRTVDSRADIYSLGVVFYEMLTGELPEDKLQPPSRKVQIDVRLDEIVLRALEAKPELRYQTAVEFRTQVETVTQSVPSSAGGAASSSAAPVKAPPGEEPPAMRWLWHAPAFLLLLIYVAFLGLLLETAPLLPDRVAIHFDLEGRPNNWFSREAHLAWMAGFPLAIIALLVLATRLMARFPSLGNVPRRDYWLTPERLPLTCAIMLRWLLGLACLVTVLMCGIHWAILQSNLAQPPRLAQGLFLPLVLGFVIATMIWALSLVMRLAEAERYEQIVCARLSRTTHTTRNLLGGAALVVLAVILARTWMRGSYTIQTDALTNVAKNKVIQFQSVTNFDNRSIVAISSVDLLPGEKILARVRPGNGRAEEMLATQSISIHGTQERQTVSLFWQLRQTDASQAESAEKQARRFQSVAALNLAEGQWTRVFAVTNDAGISLEAEACFQRAYLTNEAATADIWLRPGPSAFMIFFRHHLPAGTMLVATATNRGSATGLTSISLNVSGGESDGHATWSWLGSPGVSTAEGFNFLRQRMDQLRSDGPIRLRPGERKEIYSMTNQQSEVFTAALELRFTPPPSASP